MSQDWLKLSVPVFGTASGIMAFYVLVLVAVTGLLGVESWWAPVSHLGGSNITYPADYIIPRTVQFRATPVHENWTQGLPPTELGGNFGGWTMGLGPLVLIRRPRLRPQGRHRPVIPKIGFSGASVSLPGAGASGYSLVPEAVGALA